MVKVNAEVTVSAVITVKIFGITVFKRAVKPSKYIINLNKEGR